MKKFLALILAALMLLPLAACGSNGGKTDPQPDDHQQTTVPDNADSVKSKVEEFCGYSFTFSDKSVGERTTYGYTATTEDYSIFVYCRDDVQFDTWDNIAESAFKRMKSSLESAYSFYPTEQINSASTKTENDYGETILKVSGTMKGDQSGEGKVERQFIAFYHVTDENYVRFCIGLVDDSYAALDAAMDTLIENLKKAA
jgi:predicted small lipoprotein YifL